MIESKFNRVDLLLFLQDWQRYVLMIKATNAPFFVKKEYVQIQSA